MEHVSAMTPVDFTDIDAVFLDRGNVLYDCRVGPPDSERDADAARIVAKELSEFGIDMEPGDVIDGFIAPWKESFSQRDVRGHELPVNEFLLDYVSILKAELDASQLDSIVESMSPAYLKWNVLEPGFTELARKIRGAGRKLAIVSNAVLPDNTYLAQLEADGIRNYFDACIYSSGAGATKPNPVLIYQACERTGVEPARSVLVGDKLEKDVLCAKKAGAMAVWYNPARAPRREDIVPEYEVSSFGELSDRIRF